jgi:5,10-methylenetetrahydromethanopterin reductase
MTEFWRMTWPVAARAAQTAAEYEGQCWDGMSFTDSQNIAGDTFVSLAFAAQATSRIQLATGVTNLVTRHRATVASSIATIHSISGGRAVLGVGRGDTAIAHLGMRPQKVTEFERDLGEVQAYLRGDPPSSPPDGRSPLLWLRRAGVGKVPVDVAATGERVISVGAQLAERVTFAVGADGERLRPAIALARKIRATEAPGMGPLSLGAYVNIAVSDDLTNARSAVQGGLSAFMHFSAYHGKPAADLDERASRTVTEVASDYDLNRHGKTTARHTARLSDDFVDRFAIVGSVNQCVDRLGSLIELGLDRILMLVDSVDVAESNRQSGELIAAEVLPQLRTVATASGA